MKFPLKNIAVAVSLILCFVFIYQLYWLVGLYRSMDGQLQKNIRNAMSTADQDELFHRLDEIDKNPDWRGKISSSVDYTNDSLPGGKTYGKLKSENSYQVNNDSAKNTAFYITPDSGKVQFNIDKDKDKDDYLNYRENARITEKLASYLQMGLHQATDRIYPVNLAVFDSLLKIQMDSLKINGQHMVQLVYLPNDSVCSSFPGIIFPVKNQRHYDYHYEPEGKYAFRLYLKNANRKVIKQMSGILSTSAIIFALLIYIFIFLLKTIKKLKTEEELKTDFTNNMTHELKTPIAVSYAAVDALLVSEQQAPTGRQKRYLEIAREQMMHLSSLVEQILSMSRKNNNHIHLNREKIRLDELIASLISRFRIMTGTETGFETDIRPEKLVVYADRLHLSNILNNLIENGIKYSQGSASIRIRAREEKNRISISVEDRGIGIDVRYQQRIFDKFYRIPSGNRHDVKGYGLGLYYVKEMTKMHGGNVEVKSVPGKGSVFTIYLPA